MDIVSRRPGPDGKQPKPEPARDQSVSPAEQLDQASEFAFGQATIVDNRAASGILRRIEVSEDLRFFTFDGAVHHPFVAEAMESGTPPWMWVAIAVDGCIRVRAGDQMEREILPGDSLLVGGVERRMLFGLPPAPHHAHVVTAIRVDRVRKMLEQALPVEMTQLIGDAPERRAMQGWRVGHAGNAIALGVLAMKATGALRKLYLEGVAAQLVAMVAMAIDAQNRSHVPKSEQELLKELHAARNRLLTDLREPPSAAELADQFGTTEKRLNAEFRNHFGGSVHEVLRNERFAFAQKMLETTAMPLKEISYLIGYTHVNNFIAAFTSEFGHSPTVYRQAAQERAAAAPAADTRPSKPPA